MMFCGYKDNLSLPIAPNQGDCTISFFQETGKKEGCHYAF